MVAMGYFSCSRSNAAFLCAAYALSC